GSRRRTVATPAPACTVTNVAGELSGRPKPLTTRCERASDGCLSSMGSKLWPTAASLDTSARTDGAALQTGGTPGAHGGGAPLGGGAGGAPGSGSGAGAGSPPPVLVPASPDDADAVAVAEPLEPEADPLLPAPGGATIGLGQIVCCFVAV